MRRGLRWSIVAPLTVSLLLMTPAQARASAAGSSDQSSTDVSGGAIGLSTSLTLSGAGAAAQQFHAGRTGYLTRVRLYLVDPYRGGGVDGPGDLTVQITNLGPGDVGFPTRVIASAAVAGAWLKGTTGRWVTAQFDPAPLVFATQQYAIEVAMSGGSSFTTGLGWSHSSDDVYTGPGQSGGATDDRAWTASCLCTTFSALDPSVDMAFESYVAPAADLSLSMAAPGSVSSGSAVIYALTVTNAGPDLARDLTVSDTTPYGMVFQRLRAPTGWTCTAPPARQQGTVTCSRGFVAAGRTAAVQIIFATVRQAGHGLVTNEATLTSSTAEPSLDDNSATATTQVT